MKFHIPFTFSKLERLKKNPKLFRFLIKYRKKSRLGSYLGNADVDVSREEYLNIVYKSFFVAFIFLFVLTTTFFALRNVRLFYLWSFLISLAFSVFVAFSQGIYPKIYVARKERNIESNLIPALEDMLVQLNSGIPLFNILVNISSSDYGELSKEFKKAVKRINAGLPEGDVLEELGEKNSSLFFRRTLWQISNGMNSGSDISLIIDDSINSLHEEQIIQMQNYGNKLNPLVMFYMMITVILPALAITFLTIISSLVGLEQNSATLMFIGLFVFVILVQIMFLGAIKSARPSLL